MSYARRLGPLLVACAAALCAVACGWRTGLATPPGSRTIGIEVIQSHPRVLERNLEPRMSDAISRSVTNLVSAPLTSPYRADLIIRGRILDYRRRGGIRNQDNELRESGVFVQAEAELVARRTGIVLVPMHRKQVWSGLILDGSAPQNEAQAQNRALRYVAESLILELFGNPANSEIQTE